MSRVARAVNQFVEPVDRSVDEAIDSTRACVGLGPQRRYQYRAPASGVPPANNGKNATPVATVAPVAPVRTVPASSPMVQPHAQPQQQPPPKKKTYNPLVGLAKESWSMVKDSTMDLVKLPKAMLGYDTTGTGSRGRPVQPAPVAAAAPVADVPYAQPVGHPSPIVGVAPGAATPPVASAQTPPVASGPVAPRVAGPPGGPLPEGWGFAYDPQGRVYFLNHKERTTTYEDPRGRY